ALDGPARRARDVLDAQVLLLAESRTGNAAGRMASAGRVAENVFRSMGRVADAERVAIATGMSLAGNTPVPLREAIGAEFPAGPAPVSGVMMPPPRQEQAARTLRVAAARIDELVNLTGELTVTKNAIGHAVTLAEDGEGGLARFLKDRHAVLERLVGELQRSVLRMRVLPLRHVLQRFQRLMREMSADLGKPATLVIEGDDTEADKVIVEMLFEPLLHVFRNALDHGVESAAVRAAKGKPPVATIRLRASRQGEHVVVEVSDDGAGIDVQRIRQVARDRNAVPAEVLEAMSDTEAIELIYAPGFSTVDEVTDMSGRGVGMDAVRTAVERFAGQVSVESRAGEGTTVRFRLPFSVMMTRVMTVEAGRQQFGIPIDAVVETVRVPTDSIASVGAARAIVLRDRTLPMVELAGMLGMAHDEQRQAQATLVVVRIDGQLGALRVDRLGGQMEVMLKPLEGILVGLPGIAGSTLLGDGSVLLVLDLGELLQ
ncbi:MAG TPA: chemotaxis protein CheW, partial [Burkholderiales bacterium]|nr:chemotaxis protein CheW [Burkholderiales bacterium]